MASYGQIGSDLKALNLTSWIATSYYLTLTSFQPLYGKLSDIFGRKGCLLFAYAVFGIGCMFCGLARNINELIAARVCRVQSDISRDFEADGQIGLSRYWRRRHDRSCQHYDE